MRHARAASICTSTWTCWIPLPANPWAAADGLTPDELVEAVRRLCTRRQVRAAALTAYDPAVDPEGVVATTAVRVLQELGEGVG